MYYICFYLILAKFILNVHLEFDVGSKHQGFKNFGNHCSIDSHSCEELCNFDIVLWNMTFLQ